MPRSGFGPREMFGTVKDFLVQMTIPDGWHRGDTRTTVISYGPLSVKLEESDYNDGHILLFLGKENDMSY